MNPKYILLIITLIIFVYFQLTKKSKKSWKRKKIIISGLSGCGKTKLFYKLTRNLNIDSITSFSINEKIYSKEGDKFSIVDIPGHASFERDFISKIEEGTTIVFLVNEDNEKFIAESCQRLYNLFITKKFQELGCEIFVYLIKTPNATLNAITLEDEVEKEL